MAGATENGRGRWKFNRKLRRGVEDTSNAALRILMFCAPFLSVLPSLLTLMRMIKTNRRRAIDGMHLVCHSVSISPACLDLDHAGDAESYRDSISPLPHNTNLTIVDL